MASCLLQGAVAHASVVEEFRCLTRLEGKPISLEIHWVGDAKVKWQGGYVLYKGAKQAIPIVLQSSAVTDRPPGRPWAFEDTWVEVIQGKVTGAYKVAHQGARITSFTYTSAKDGKVFYFDEDLEHMAESSCQWS
ncbi:MAG: hypothetical protein RI907_3479 [Pseudomonadota bacterium]